MWNSVVDPVHFFVGVLLGWFIVSFPRKAERVRQACPICGMVHGHKMDCPERRRSHE